MEKLVIITASIKYELFSLFLTLCAANITIWTIFFQSNTTSEQNKYIVSQESSEQHLFGITPRNMTLNYKVNEVPSRNWSINVQHLMKDPYNVAEVNCSKLFEGDELEIKRAHLLAQR